MEAFLESSMDRLQEAAQRIPRKLAALIRPRSAALADFVDLIDIDAPLTTTFCFSCFILQLWSTVAGQGLIMKYFAVPSFSGFSFLSARCYWTVFGQILGHASWEHLSGNMVNILLVGPTCERVFGRFNLLKIILWTAVASGVAHILIGPRHSAQLGASGVVFMLILLNSLVEARMGRVPLTFLLQVAIWCNKEVVAQFLRGSGDSVSHVAHLVGAVVGALAGYRMHEQRVMEYAKKIGTKWLQRQRRAVDDAIKRQ